MEKVQLLIGRLLQISVFISLIVVVIGGGWYLLNHGGEVVHYQSFHGEIKPLGSIKNILYHAFASSLNFIQLGLLFLVVAQWVRVALTIFYFIKLRSLLFTVISLFILIVLTYALLGNL